MRVKEVTPEIIEAWKQTFRAVYKTNISDQDFYFRPLTRSELLAIRNLVRDNNLSLDEFDEKIVDYCLLSPDWMIADFLGLEAGVLSALSRVIQERSLIGVDTSSEVVHDDLPKFKVDKEVIEQNRLLHKRLLLVSFAGSQFLIRPLSRAEWAAITKKQQENQNLDVDMEVCKIGLLYPALSDLEELPAGVVQRLSDSIMESSGFTETPKVEKL